VQWIEADAQPSRVLEKSLVHEGNEAAVSFGITPHCQARDWINLAAVDYVCERSFGIVEVVKGKEFSFSKDEADQLVVVSFGITKALFHLIVLVVSERTRRRKDNFGQMSDNEKRAMNAFLLQGRLGFLNSGSDGTANSAFVVRLHLSQHRDAVRPWPVVNELVVVAADQKQIGVFISILVSHGRVASRPLATVCDDVSHLSKDGGIVGFAARLDQAFTAVREGAYPARKHEQGLDFLLWNVAAQAPTLHETAGSK
jgi:hypothetical protein